MENENQNDNSTQSILYHFSKKVLFLSLLFLLVNAAWFSLAVVQQSVGPFREVAPRIVFSEGQEVSLKTPYDSTYLSAQPDQVLLTNSYIKTGDQSFAEIRIEDNVIRLDQNTEIRFLENHFLSRHFPRFVFQLESGSVWVNAFDPIIISTPRGDAQFSHSVGSYTYNRPLNRVFSITGNVDLNLKGSDGEELARFVIPLKNQIVFADSQIIPEYARLEYTKMKKELKMGPVSPAIFEEEWVQRNAKNDVIRLLSVNDVIYSTSIYEVRSRYHEFREKLALIPSQKRMERLQLAELKFQYLLGGVHKDNDSEKAESLLAELDDLKEILTGDPLFNNLLESQFYSIYNVPKGSSAYLTKEYLRQYLLSRDKNPEILRTYLADLDYLLRSEDNKKAIELTEHWVEQWKPGFKKSHRDEFDQQVRIYQNILLSYADRIDTKLLTILDKIGDYRLANAEEGDETLFEIALERLEVSKYLIAALRYPEAKTYLKTSYSQLNLSEKETSAARDLFIQEAALLADRIAFAEQSLRAAAEEEAEQAQFKDYLANQERDKTLSERFEEILKEEEPQDDVILYPTLHEVSQRFTVARIALLEEDIAVDTEDPFSFEIKSARFVDRAQDGTLVSFSAQYDYSTNGIYDIVLNDDPLGGSFTLDDFVRIAKSPEASIKIDHLPDPDAGDLVDFLNLDTSEEAARSQATAQDLAIQLTIKELEGFGILISSDQQMTILNTATLNEFKVSNVFIEDDDNRKTSISFKYNTSNKIASDISLKEDQNVGLPSTLSIDRLVNVVFTSLYGKEQEVEAVRSTVKEFVALNLVIDERDIRFADSDRNIVEFKKVRLDIMPIEFAGTFNRASKTFISTDHKLLVADNQGVKEYISYLSELWLIDYLTKQGIELTEVNIITPLPAERVKIEDYERGDKILNFTFEVNSNRLANISIHGVDSVVNSLSFEEFANIKGNPKPVEAPVEEPAEEEPSEETIEEPIEELLEDTPSIPVDEEI